MVSYFSVDERGITKTSKRLLSKEKRELIPWKEVTGVRVRNGVELRFGRQKAFFPTMTKEDARFFNAKISDWLPLGGRPSGKASDAGFYERLREPFKLWGSALAAPQSGRVGRAILRRKCPECEAGSPKKRCDACLGTGQIQKNARIETFANFMRVEYCSKCRGTGHLHE